MTDWHQRVADLEAVYQAKGRHLDPDFARAALVCGYSYEQVVARSRFRDQLVYLATPYSKYHEGLDAAFQRAAHVAGMLIKWGVTVYSPIAHTHPIAEEAGIDKTDELWYTFNHKLMNKCESCVVVTMDGWQQSTGVTYERGYFQGQGKPVWYLDPTDYWIAKDVCELSRPATL